MARFGITAVVAPIVVIIGAVALWGRLDPLRDPSSVQQREVERADIDVAPPSQPRSTDCAVGAFEEAAQVNAETVKFQEWAPFGRTERGWEIYAPHVAKEVRTDCDPATTGFAQALAEWQRKQGLPGDGVLSLADIQKMKTDWHGERPYVQLRGEGVCPDPPPPSQLEQARPEEGYRGKVIHLRPGALRAYRRMVADARRELPELQVQPEMLTIFSGYRDPASDAARCAEEGNCQGITRASCSVHRTGLAIDIVVGQAPGHTVDSSADINRLHMSRTAAYRWLVENAERYGFVNYVFEPWHWEWTGERIEVAGT